MKTKKNTCYYCIIIFKQANLKEMKSINNVPLYNYHH